MKEEMALVAASAAGDHPSFTQSKQTTMDQSCKEQGVLIPHDQLSPDALEGLVEEFVTRNGTDNGYTHNTLSQNVKMVLGQLNRGEAVIMYDHITQTANIVPNPSH